MERRTTAPTRTSTLQTIRLLILFLMVITFPITMNYFSVFLIIEGSAKGVVVFSFFFWSLFAITSLVFGRAACGYICPLGAFQEVKDRMVPRRLTRIKYLKSVKYVLAFAWVGGIVYAAVYAGGYETIDLLYKTESGVSVDTAEGWITYAMIIVIILLPAFILGKRGFCHYLCPWGVLNTVGPKAKGFLRLPSLHLKVTTDKCKQCKRCDSNCPMSLPVSQMVQNGSMNNTECILCGTCVGNCPNGTIEYSWQRQSERPSPR